MTGSGSDDGFGQMCVCGGEEGRGEERGLGWAVSVGGSAKDKRLEMSCSIILMNWKLDTSQEAWSSAKS